MNQCENNHIIYQAKTSTEALRGLYEYGKSVDRCHSLAYYCRRAGISSTGYLSDVLSGKRRLHSKYRIGITRAFNLSKEATSCLRLLIDIDNETDPDRVEALKIALSLGKKTLKVSYLNFPQEAQDFFGALDIFCAFGLFANQPTKRDLELYFKSSKEHDVEASLQVLESLGLVRADGKSFCLIHDHVIFGGQGGGISHLDFLKLAIAHAAKNVEAWFEHRDKSYFTSTVVSVRKKDYIAVLQDLKDKMLRVQSEIESSQADMLVRFNVQVYPILDPSIKISPT